MDFDVQGLNLQEGDRLSLLIVSERVIMLRKCSSVGCWIRMLIKPNCVFRGIVRGGARNRCQAVGILHLTRTQDKGIKSSKDRGVDADAQGEREDGHGSEAWILAQHAHAVT